jgi:hypothetical protein
LVAAQVQDFGPAHAITTVNDNFVAASTVVAEDDSDYYVFKCFESDDSRSSIVWTEESSDEDLDYFVALDVAAAEASPRVMGDEDLPGVSVGHRRRRAVAKRRVSELPRGDRRHRGEVGGGCLRVDGAGKREFVTPQVLPWLEHTLVLRSVITCGKKLKEGIRTLEAMC